jgi:hypothetical protein
VGFEPKISIDMPEITVYRSDWGRYLPAVAWVTLTGSGYDVCYSTKGIVVGNHDIAVTNITSSKRVIGTGFVNNITVTIQNHGDFPETFNLTVRANTVDIVTKQVTLENGTSTVILFSWNTTGYVYGNYTLSAYAEPVLGETETEDNTFVDGLIIVSIPGDIKGDFIVNILDAILLSNAYNSKPGTSNWNINADINSDDIVNILDAIILSNHYLQHYP